MKRIENAGKILAVVLIIYLIFQIQKVPQLGLKEELNAQGPLVGFSIHFMQDDYAVHAVESFEKVMEEAGYRTIVVSADGDSKKQVADIEEMIRQGVSAIGVCPMSEEAIRNSLISAQKQGIKVVTITEIPDFTADAVIYGREHDNGYGAGKCLAEALKDQEEIEVAVLDFPYKVSRTKERVAGCKKALREYGIPVTVVGRPATNEEAMDFVKDLLEKNPKIKGIFGSYSNQVIGAGAACKALGREDITVVGVDADTLVLKLIQEGWVLATAAQFPKEHGAECAKAIIKLLEGETITEAYAEPYLLVDGDNAAEASKTLWG